MPARNDLRPHFHTSPTPAGHDHRHDGTVGHRHHGEGDNHPELGTPQPEPLSQDDHDSDAVYIDRVDIVLGERSAPGDELAASLLWAAVGSYLPISFCAEPALEAVNWTHAPPLCGYACPLYLRQLTLLI